MKKIRILIADDHSVVRLGLTTLLTCEPDFAVVAEADNGASALAQAETQHPDVAILDLKMPVLDGVAATAAICAACPGTRVLILTSFHESDDVKRALEAGAAGVVAKHTADSDLISAVRAVAAGERLASAEQSATVPAEPKPIFTQRQSDILHAVARGLSNAEIGLMYGITKDMVKAHVKVVLHKLGAANRTEAVAIALRQHLLTI